MSRATLINDIMEELSLHIEYLLLRHDCIIVPGFGAFINVRESAAISEAENRILPMQREVRFNSALNHEDGMLAHSFARRHRLSFAAGRDMVRRESESLQMVLESDGEATLGRLGIIRRNNEGNLSFHPFLTAKAITEEYGYHPVTMPDKISSEAEMSLTESSKLEDSNCTLKNPRQFDTNKNYYIAINKIFARVAASLILTVAIALSFMIPGYNTGHEEKASVMPVDEIITKNVEKATQPTPATSAAPIVKEKDAEPYHLIVATFRTRGEAENFIRQHVGSEYHLFIHESKKMCRISAKSANTYSELQNVLNSKSFKDEYGECWIWKDESRQ